MMQTKNKPVDDLEYLSQLGFERTTVSDREIRELRKKVRSRFFPATNPFYLILVSGLVGIFIGAIVFYSVYTPVAEKDKMPTSTFSAQQVVPVEENEIQHIELNTVEVVKENFVKPAQVKTQSLAETQEHTSLEMDTLQVVALQPTYVSNASENALTEKKIKFIINSPVVFIHDLKVSDYASLYFKKNQFVKFNNRTGLTAEYSSKNESAPASHLKQQPDYFLHQELADGLLYFKQKKYDACIISLNDVATYNKTDVNCDFYLGMSYYNKKNFSKAILFFNACIENPNNAFLQEAMYYKASALLEQGNKNDAVQLLRKIIDEGQFYSEKAKMALENL